VGYITPPRKEQIKNMREKKEREEINAIPYIEFT
jgi:hypothetical protein